MIYLIAYFTLGAIAAVFSYGMTVAYFWHEFPILQEEKGRFSELQGRGVFFAILVFIAPLTIIVSFLIYDKAKHGLMFKQPK